MSGWTLERHILEEQRTHPGATGEFTRLFQQLALAGKIIASRVNQAGLAGVLGVTGEINVQGERVQKLDVFANSALIHCLEARRPGLPDGERRGRRPDPDPDATTRSGKYVLMFDPLDGSSNIDVNISIGTIFSVHRRVTRGRRSRRSRDCLQPGYKQVAAGYIIYGSSTMLVYTTGEGVHGFTLDPSVGEFFLSHPNMRMPERGKIYSVNEGNEAKWDDARARLGALAEDARQGRAAGPTARATSARWSPTSTARCSRAACSPTRRTQEPERQAAAALRGLAAGVRGQGGRRRGLDGRQRDPRHRADRAAPARAAVHRQPARRGGRGRGWSSG